MAHEARPNPAGIAGTALGNTSAGTGNVGIGGYVAEGAVGFVVQAEMSTAHTTPNPRRALAVTDDGLDARSVFANVT
jgi:hypothetical protein